MWERIFGKKETPQAQKNTTRKNRKSVVVKIEPHAPDRSEKDIQKWRMAISMAEDIYNPSRLQLQELYRELAEDTHLHAQMQLRTLTTISRKFQLVDADGNPDKELTEHFRQSWFYDFMRMAIDSRYYGHTLLELQGFTQGMPHYATIKRQNVVPEQMLVRYSQFSDEGEYFDPDERFIIEIGDRDDLGLLLKTAPYVLYKKNSFQSWSQYAEIFGMPMRWATTNSRDANVLDQLEDSLYQMGEAAYGVFPEGTKLELKETSKGDGYNVYDKLTASTNQEISKCINSVTMLSDDGSSRSQSEVHLEVNDRITFADGFFIQSNVNTKLLPKLALFDAKYANRRFAWDDTIKLPVELQWKITESLLGSGHKIPIDWISETFNIPIEGREEKQPETNEEDPDDSPPPNFKLARPKSTAVPKIVAAAESGIDKLVDKLLRKVFKQKDFAKNLESKEFEQLVNHVAGHLYKGVEKGYGKKLIDLDWETPDAEMLRALRGNVYQFSAFKQAGLLAELHELLEKDGRVREWQDFKTEAKQKNKLYNVNWLRTEYDQAVAAAQMASKWVSFQDGKDRFYLRYETVGDELVRKSHDKLDGITLPVDHPFWKKYFPPNGWGCRCIVVQVPISSNKETNLNTIDLIDPDEGFGFNPGIEQKVLKPEGYKGRLPEDFMKRNGVSDNWFSKFFKKESKNKSSEQEWFDIHKTTEINGIENIPHIENQIRDALDALRREGDIEVAALFSPDGKVIFKKRGGKNHVNFSSEESKMMEGNILIHNHLSNCAFSFDDIETFLTTNTKEGRVVVDSGTYIFKGAYNGEENLFKAYNEIRNKHLPIFAKKREIPDELIEKLFDEAVWEEFCTKFGFYFKHEDKT